MLDKTRLDEIRKRCEADSPALLNPEIAWHQQIIDRKDLISALESSQREIERLSEQIDSCKKMVVKIAETIQEHIEYVGDE